MFQTLLRNLAPKQILVYGYSLILLLGFLLLCLPWLQQVDIPVIDNLFVATSALSTTGLSTIDVGTHYNAGGQIVLLILIQIGGLGYMSLGSFVVLMRRSRLKRLNTDLINYDFSLPEGFNVRHFIKSMVVFSLVLEVLGAVLLTWIFAHNGESAPLWKGVFHSISAFCTAGFSLFPNGLEDYHNNFYLNAVIGTLAISGALGFIVFTDYYEKWSGQKDRITLTSRIILRFTFGGILVGAVLIFLSDPRIADLPPVNRILLSFFQSMTAFTTVGFNTYPIGEIAPGPLFLVMLLMVVGASPSGTGGGMKSTTITALYARLRATFRGQQDVTYLGCRIPDHRINMATSNFFFYILMICLGAFLLLLVQPQDKFDLLFEAVSALGTVGLSTGITGDLTSLGKITVVFLMFLGRMGPLSFGIALFRPGQSEPVHDEDLAI